MQKRNLNRWKKNLSVKFSLHTWLVALPLVASLSLMTGCDLLENILNPTSRDGEADGGIVVSVAQAPIVADGDVAGAVPIIDIILDTSLDPAVPGRTLLEGKTIKVTFPPEFVDSGELPTMDVFSSPDCAPGNFRCNTGALVQGWSQHPILPLVPPGPDGTPHYTVSMEGTNTMVYTALVDIVPGLPAPGPGIKVIHILLFGFVNPAPGVYDLKVVAETGPGGAVETGVAKLRIRPSIQPTIRIASAFNEGSPNTIYQSTAPSAATLFPYDLLLWDSDGAPLTGVTIAPLDTTQWSLVRGEGEVIGSVSLSAPSGATGQELTTTAPSFAINAPVSAVPTARLTVQFIAGSASGDYVLTFSLNGGNSIRTFVKVQ